MAEKAIERYDSYGYDGLSGIMKPHPAGDWMRYDAELVRDAMRYRWLRENCLPHMYEHREFAHAVVFVSLGLQPDGKIHVMQPGTEAHVGIPSLDTAIDTAIAQAEGGEG